MNRFPSEPRWWSSNQLDAASLPKTLATWLLDRDSLTYRLQRSCPGRFAVQVLSQRRVLPMRNEARVLRMRRGRYGLIREVRLLCGERPCVFARTVIPYATLRAIPRLGRLGSKPLGAVLFSDKHMYRGELEVARIRPPQKLFDVATQALAQKPLEIWGRRSVFYLGSEERRLLVSEIFLPAISECGRD